MQSTSFKNNSSKDKEFCSWRKVRDWIKEWSRDNNFDINTLVSSLEVNLDKADKEGNNAENTTESRKSLVSAYKIREPMMKKKSRVQWKFEEEQFQNFSFSKLNTGEERTQSMGC